MSNFRIATVAFVAGTAAMVSAIACTSSAPGIDPSFDGGAGDGGEEESCTNAIKPSVDKTVSPYPMHTGIIATVFWVGESASTENGFIHNYASAWQDKWESDYGGVDDPEERRGYQPSAFTPKENPFYIALPYNDLDDDGKQKANAAQLIPWFDANVSPTTTQLKDRWVEVKNGDRYCFGQWEDVGPYLETDETYVFGKSPPANHHDPSAGIDLSPAMATCLCIDDQATVSWRFVDRDKIPAGPWLQIVTGAK